MRMNNYFIEHLKRRLANTSIGPSTLRGMAPKGTIDAVRAYLISLDLRVFQINNEKEFIHLLNNQTLKLKNSLPLNARYGGLSRKSLNIFLRGINYNRFLCKEYNLLHLEPWLEIPLDSHVAKGLKNEPEGTDLPKWKGVKHLDKQDSEKYQDIAKKVANRLKTFRVHLDLLYWRGEHLKSREKENHETPPLHSKTP